MIHIGRPVVHRPLIPLGSVGPEFLSLRSGTVHLRLTTKLYSPPNLHPIESIGTGLARLDWNEPNGSSEMVTKR